MTAVIGGFFMPGEKVMARLNVQGSRWWAYDKVTASLIRLECLKTFEPGSDSAGKIEITCLDDEDTKSYLPGLTDPGEGSMGFDFDEENASHMQIYTWADAKKELTLIQAAKCDQSIVPTVENGELKIPDTRTFWRHEVTLTSPSWKFDADALVNCTVTLQRRAKTTLLAKVK